MEGGRSWQRGNSKNGRGVSGSRPLQQPADSDIDPMMQSVKYSQISNVVKGARASLHENMRPQTPGDLPRHLFSGDDYTNRPGSSYKMKNVIGQAVDEFQSAIANTTATSNMTANSGGIQMISGKTLKLAGPRSGSQNKDTNIEAVLKKAEFAKKPKLGPLPALDHTAIQNKGLVSKSAIKQFDSNRPVKVLQQQQSSDNSLQSIPEKPTAEVKKVTIKKQKSGVPKEDYSEFLKEDQRFDDSLRFDQCKIDNLQKLQSIQQEIKSANRRREDEEGEAEDDYEDYFEQQMMQDLQGIDYYEQQVDYFEALKKIEGQVKDINQEPVEVTLEEQYLMQNIEEGEDDQQGYVGEYYDVINEMSKICAVIAQNNKTEVKDKKVKIDEEALIELCPRIWALATEYEKQPQDVKEQCFLETIIKGSFSLLAAKHPRSVLRLSACNIHLFLKIFEQYIYSTDHTQLQDFKKVFNYLFETMRGILIYAKEGTHDLLFKQENLIPQLSRVIQICFLERAELVVKLTTQIVNKKEIVNDDMIYDLVNYTIGSIKCFTQSNVEVQKEAVKQRYIMMLSKCIDKAMSFGKNQTKKSQMLVQICGALRNLSNDEESYQQFCANKIIPKLINILEQFKGHKELMLNISRILSKISMDGDCSYQIIQTNKLGYLVDLMTEHQAYSPFLIRIAFVIANLTTYFEEAREQVGNTEVLKKVVQAAIYYLQKDENPEPAKQSAQGKRDDLANLEESLVKLIRLMANICTEEKYITQILRDIKELMQEFTGRLISAIERKSIQTSEEFLLNAISCTTNLLFYDTPSTNLFNTDLRLRIFQSIKTYILETQNEEIQIEAVRVLSNLSRHAVLCEEFVSDKTFLETLIVVLDHTLRDLVFYTIGIIINITMHEASRPKVLDKNVIPKLIDVLKDANIEDMDLSKVAAKALHNIVGESNYWTMELIKKLDEVLSNLGEELDSIMDVANEEELDEIKSLRNLVNALINDMPEPMFGCPDEKCGRKFKIKEELDKHFERRHNQKPPK